ncbi:response regulator [Schlegelella sp. S2-27]|uniref:Response regulator n=1 Tax=Caldimonas mangrovi TaxID=2944811 RepID=A0ABT0YIR8_9BURK|nr:HD domain-containing phosphohydrolase [Caldimonas mangrovi]MCM5678609.1 response regulator [Caldimonas mangrovi]
MDTTTDAGPPPPRAQALLIVDDEPHVLSALRRALRGTGCTIHTAPGGQQALQILAEHPIDLIISDMRMPGMSGAELLRGARERAPETIRILLTGYADLRSTMEAVNDGEIFRFLTKPWEDPILLEAVQEGLQRRVLEQERDELRALTQQQNAELKRLNGGLEQLVAERTGELQRTLGDLEAATDRLKSDFTSTVKLLSSLVASRSGIAAGCPRAVARYVREVAPELGIAGEQIADLTFAALLQDVGKLGLPDELLRVPFAALNRDQRARLRRHPVAGEACLMALPSLAPAGAILRHLYENFDGSGKPDSLAGDAIPLASRLLRVLTDYEHYRSGAIELAQLPEEHAFQRLRQGRAGVYDPRCVDAFLKSRRQAVAVPRQSKLLSSDRLEPGMEVGQDLMSKAGTLLLSQGHVLDAALIRQIQRYEHFSGEFLWIKVLTDAVAPAAS